MFTWSPELLVSAPDPSQPQHRSLPASCVGKEVILEAIRVGVGLGLGPRLQNCVTRQHLSQVEYFTF